MQFQTKEMTAQTRTSSEFQPMRGSVLEFFPILNVLTIQMRQAFPWLHLNLPQSGTLPIRAVLYAGANKSGLGLTSVQRQGHCIE